MDTTITADKVRVCAQCGNEIPFETPYYMVGDNFLQTKYFDSESDNIFCSQNCLCEALSVIEIPNDGSKSLWEELGLNFSSTSSSSSASESTDVLEIVAGVYPEDAAVNGEDEPDSDSENPEYKMPGIKKNDYGYIWNVKIDIPTGKILDWPQGTTATTYYKTADCCGLKYMGKSYENYAPDFLSVFDEGYGDYIYLEILEDGTIKDWNADECRMWLKEKYDYEFA